MSSKSAIQIESLRKAYGAQTVLKDLSLRLEAGQALGLVGVNGAGKTTLIRCLLDFCAIDAGSIEIFGQSHRKVAAREPLAYLPERFQPPYFATGHEFISRVGKLHGVLISKEQLLEAAKRLELSADALDKPVRTLSKGMSQKLGLLAALLTGRDMLVLDEPMSGLDPLARALVKRELAARQANGGTLLLCTHLLADVEDLCDRLVVLHNQRLVFDGSIEAFRASRPGASLEEVYLNWVRAVA